MAGAPSYPTTASVRTCTRCYGGAASLSHRHLLHSIGILASAFHPLYSFGKKDWDCIRGLGDSLMELERYEDELEHRKQHLATAIAETNRVEMQRAYTLVGNSHRAIAVYRKETPKEQAPFFDAALAAHSKSCEIATGLKDTLMAGNSHFNMACVSLDRGGGPANNAAAIASLKAGEVHLENRSAPQDGPPTTYVLSREAAFFCGVLTCAVLLTPCVR